MEDAIFPRKVKSGKLLPVSVLTVDTFGKVMWEQPKTASGTVIRCADNLLIFSDTGELQLAKASPKEFKIKSRFQAVGGTTRNYPAIADGFVYVRGPKKLVCLDLRGRK